MDWTQLTFNWNQARAFWATAELGSLSAAARALQMSQPTLSRQVDALEEALDVVLFERVGRGLTLTPSGLDLLEHVKAMGEAAAQLSLAAAGKSQTIEGPVSVTSGEAIAAFLLPPVWAELRRQAPGVVVEVVASAQVQDLRRREADIALRNVRPQEPDLVAQKLRDVDIGLYASPSYAAQLGHPSTLQAFNALDHVDLIGFDTSDALMQGLNAAGMALSSANFRLSCENHLVGWQMVQQGLGVGVMQADIGDACDGVVRLLPDFVPLRVPIWLTAHREVHTSRRVRLVYDLLAELF